MLFRDSFSSRQFLVLFISISCFFQAILLCIIDQRLNEMTIIIIIISIIIIIITILIKVIHGLPLQSLRKPDMLYKGGKKKELCSGRC